MKLVYVTNVRIPTPRAQGYAIMKMCEAFSMEKIDISLVIPDRNDSDNLGDPLTYYNLKNKFEIVRLFTFDLLSKTHNWGRLFYWLDIFSFLVSLRVSKLLSNNQFVYTRDYIIIFLIPRSKKIFLELHDIPKSKILFKFLIKRVNKFVVLNTKLEREIIDLGVDRSRILISPSGVDMEDFNFVKDKIGLRGKLNLPINKKIVTYTGHFYSWKGVDTLAKVSEILDDYIFVFIGGVDPDLKEFLSKYGKLKNIIVVPFVKREIVPKYLAASDVLVLPNTPAEKISSSYTSPLKMFEYMASRVPIVASDLPSLREVLNEKNCIFAEADNPNSFAKSIKSLIENENLSRSVAEQAYQDVNSFTWDKRAKKIINFIKK